MTSAVRMTRKLRLGNSVPCRLSLPSGQIPGDPAAGSCCCEWGRASWRSSYGLDATDNGLEHIGQRYNAAPSLSPAADSPEPQDHCRFGSTPCLGPGSSLFGSSGGPGRFLAEKSSSEEIVLDAGPLLEASGVDGAVTGPVGAPSDPFDISDRTIKGVMCSRGRAKARCAMPTGGSGECGRAFGRKKSDLRANHGRPESHAGAVRSSCCQVSIGAGVGVGLAFFLKARSIRGNITIEQTTTTEAFSRIMNAVTIKPLSISSKLICQRRSIGVAKRRPPSSRNA